jgi:hypothetical protein
VARSCGCLQQLNQKVSALPQRDTRASRFAAPRGIGKNSHRFAVKFLLAVMNSSAARDFLRANRQSNIHPDDWKQLPIPDVTREQQTPIVQLVDRILAAKQAAPHADTTALEREIDQRVYQLYDLSPEEIAIVEEGRRK